MFDSCVSLATVRPKLVLFIILSVCIVGVLGIARVELELDARRLLPSEYARLVPSDAACDRFRSDDEIAIVVESLRGTVFQPNVYQVIFDLENKVNALDVIIDATCRSMLSVPLLTTDHDILDVRPAISRQHLSSAEFSQILQTQIKESGFNDGTLVSDDHTAAVIIAQVHDDTDRVQLLTELRRILRASVHSADIKFHIVGNSLAQGAIGEESAKELIRIVPIVVGVLILTLTALYRSIVPALICVCEAGISLLLTTAILGAAGTPIHITTLVLPAIILIIAVSDDVFAFEYIAQAGDATSDLNKALCVGLRRIKIPLVLTGVSTGFGFLGLCFADLQVHRTFGLFGAVAIGISFVMTFTFLPAALSIFGKCPRTSWSIRHCKAAANCSLSRKFPGVHWGITVAVWIAAAVCAGAYIRVDDSWVTNLPPDNDVRRGAAFQDAVMAGGTTLNLQIEVNPRDELLDPDVFLDLLQIDEQLRTVESVGACRSMPDNTIRALCKLYDLSYRNMRESLLNGTIQITQTDIASAQLILASTTNDLFTDETSRYVRFQIFVTSASHSTIQRVVEETHRVALTSGELVFFGDGWNSTVAVDSIVQDNATAVAIAGLAEVVLLTFAFGRVRIAVLILIPVAFGISAGIIYFVVSGTPVGIANSLFASISLGLGIDYGIHYLAGSHMQHQADALNRAELATWSSLTTITPALGVFLFCEVPTNRQLGISLLISMAACATSAIYIFPKILRRDTPRI